jgi:hypothetical protein
MYIKRVSFKSLRVHLHIAHSLTAAAACDVVHVYNKVAVAIASLVKRFT